MKIKVAAVTFDLERVESDKKFWQRVDRRMEQAADEGATLSLLPEYFCLSWLLFKSGDSFSRALNGFRSVSDVFHHEFQSLSQKYKMTIVAGSAPVSVGRKLVNRSFIYQPRRSEILFQDKRHMTRFENEVWKISPGPQRYGTFVCGGVRCAVVICYDVEFADIIPRVVSQNVDVLLVPSCTDDEHGYWRVRHCTEARAVETQSYCVMTSIVGGDKRHSEINGHFGRSSFHSPCDLRFEVGGVLAEGPKNKEVVSVSTLDLQKLKWVRRQGTVFNRRDSR